MADVEISPVTLDFGYVAVSDSVALLVTVMNVGVVDLTVTAVRFPADDGGDFALSGVPALPRVLSPGSSFDVAVRFSPTAVGLMLGNLEIASEDPNEPLARVEVLVGNGVAEAMGPTLALQRVLEEAMGEGTPGRPGDERFPTRARVFVNMIEAAGDLLAAGLRDPATLVTTGNVVDAQLVRDACGQLRSALARTDGQARPPDFVTGEAAPRIEAAIEVVIGSLGCT